MGRHKRRQAVAQQQRTTFQALQLNSFSGPLPPPEAGRRP
jgi:hypothetical protein